LFSVLHGHRQEQLAEIQQDGFRTGWEGPEVTAKTRSIAMV